MTDNAPAISSANYPTIESLNEACQKALMLGDLKGLTPPMKVEYYSHVCKSLGLNPMTQPFDYLVFQGKERLYANKNCAEQLRKIYGISVTKMTKDILDGVLYVECHVAEPGGRTDVGTAALSIKGLAGTELANAFMKCETKAKRRATLSICGLGMLDETEVDDNPRLFRKKSFEDAHAPEVRMVEVGNDIVDTATGEVIEAQPADDWESYKYAYFIPYQKLSAYRGLLRESSCRWRPKKDRETGEEIPGGDNAWYGNVFIPELKDFMIRGLSPEAEADDIPESFTASGPSDIDMEVAGIFPSINK
jgi:hypothetical protein